MEASLHMYDQSLTLFPAPLWRMGSRVESFKLLIMSWCFWLPSSVTHEISTVLGSLCQEPQADTHTHAFCYFSSD